MSPTFPGSKQSKKSARSRQQAETAQILHGVISQEIEFFITTAVGTLSLYGLDVDHGLRKSKYLEEGHLRQFQDNELEYHENFSQK
jgi:hypothetical protein